MPLVFPPLFENLLSSDKSLRASVDTLAADLGTWIEVSKLPFFEDYTDHGVDHLNSVLSTSEGLMPEVSRGAFTTIDCGVLIIAILYHDLAMHLSEAGFYTLIKGAGADWAIKGFGEKSWPTLWEEFLFTALHWDDKRLKSVLGETDDGHPISEVRDPFITYNNLSTTDRKLIGEFIRIHHPRIAHEMAVFGIPGPTVHKPTLAIDPKIMDLSGLVARSHGLPLRECLDYLGANYHKREYNGLHAIYLMTLVRVADYIQIQPQRAPRSVFQYKHIPSKTSELEWCAHDSIENITFTHDDPESIEIVSRPKDVHTYLRVKEWLAGIQRELDESWAILGEAYGRNSRLSKLGLLLRRVRSNLDDPAVFAEGVDFIPDSIELNVARPDLLSLLVGPLYDNIPSIGVRELMQNSLDAVREWDFLSSKHPEIAANDFLDQRSDVEIWLDDEDGDGYSLLTVSDRGIGMSLDVIKKFFLTAGASFRNSDEWKKLFTPEDSQIGVARSGRFGVGVLAGFLLGKEIEVSTRHFRDGAGYTFKVTLDNEPIEVRRDATLKIGTTICIRVSSAIKEQLKKVERIAVPKLFDWYVGAHPSVERYLGKDRQRIRSLWRNYHYNLLFDKYHHLAGFTAYPVEWTSNQKAPALSVNGIVVTDSASLHGSLHSDTDGAFRFSVSRPSVNVVDRTSSFPINLRRDGLLQDGFDFESFLLPNALEQCFASLLLTEGTPRIHSGSYQAVCNITPMASANLEVRTRYFGVDLYPFFGYGSGFVPAAASITSKLTYDCFVLQINRRAPLDAMSVGQGCLGGIVGRFGYPQDGGVDSDLATLLRAAALISYFCSDPEDVSSRSFLEDICPGKRVNGVRLLIPELLYESWINLEEKLEQATKNAKHPNKNYWESNLEESRRLVLTAQNYLRASTEYGERRLLGSNSNMFANLPIMDFAPTVTGGCFVEIQLADEASTEKIKAGKFSEMWLNLIGPKEIPSEISSRKAGLKSAFDRLERFYSTVL